MAGQIVRQKVSTEGVQIRSEVHLCAEKKDLL